MLGTNDTGATDTNPAGSGSPNNMVLVTSNVYDGGSAGGDGNLTQQTQYVSATSGDTRVTNYTYDFRDRRTSTTDAINRYNAYTYDNMDRVTETDGYNVSGGTLITKGATNYDNRNRAYQQLSYAVNPSSGAVGNALVSNTWYDPSGNVIQQIKQGDGNVFTKSAYNGMGWVTSTHRGYNTTGTSYPQAGTVTNDIIVTQSVPVYNEVGSIVSQAMYDRLNTTASTVTGALTTGNARVSYTAAWFDGIDRSIANANYGAIPTFARPTATPASSSTVLVNSTVYDNAGRVDQAIDPKGITTQTVYDAAGRTTQSIEDYGTGKLNRTTHYTYTLDNQIATLVAVNSTTGNQTTTYTFGTSLTSSSVARNDLLASVAYPDSVSGSDVVTYAYNRLGQQRTITDQRGTIHTIYFDKLGRTTNDCITTVGSGTDSALLQIATAFEIRGMAQTITSYNSATQNSGTILNQVQLSYNTFGQVVDEQQNHGGAVSGSSPAVQYNYSTGASGSNQIRPVGLTYPNGRIISLSYGTSDGMNDYMNRIDTIADTTSGTTNLASYVYLGTSTVVQVIYSQPGVTLDLWGGTGGEFNGLDLFNRIVDQRWHT